MSTIANLYADFKTLCQQWFYTKSEVDTALNGKSNTAHTHSTWTNLIPTHTYGAIWVNEELRICQFRYYRQNYNFTSTNEITFGTNIVPNGYRPTDTIAVTIYNVLLGGIIDTSGNFKAYASATGTRTINASAMWHY